MASKATHARRLRLADKTDTPIAAVESGFMPNLTQIGVCFEFTPHKELLNLLGIYAPK